MQKQIIKKYYKFFIDKHKTRLDNYLIEKLPIMYTRSIIHKIIILGNVYINQKQIINKKYKLKKKDIIEIYNLYINKENFFLKSEKIKLHIIYEDEYLLIINKPFNSVVHPGTRNPKGTILNGIKFYLQKTKLKKPYLANRIDKETSGLIIVVTDEKILKNISKQFTLNLIKKKYIALVNGNIKKNNITIYSNIIRNRKTKYNMDITKFRGKVCISSFKVIERLKYITVLKCRLYTGRTHQIRVHLKKIGHPIFNDKKYGGDQILCDNIPLCKKKIINHIIKNSHFIALHANSLELIHPIFLKTIKYNSIIPYQIYLLIKIMSTL
ncbi:Pseudouridine synthase [Candidatus Karelsulcia muelleri]|uniref:RluA family pseudouridine synthase n=1 Tax=Candidatus Karelsulcia muelleri TaxID=336810 RepID=UPI001FF19998|nr:RluA family pseudouridine synthase [Candidatus Karelsulcia muelleri]UOQ27741.1 Pseudouridine synthase [Candidatus Karelsulcia muelleri]